MMNVVQILFYHYHYEKLVALVLINFHLFAWLLHWT